MASATNIRSFIQAWEGGLSRDPGDSASSFPAPWPWKDPKDGIVKTGWHTNTGVTYKSFVGLAPKLGYELKPDTFFVMPDKVWGGIYKVGYWDKWYLDKMNSQAIADLIADFAWGSGVNGSFQSVRKYLAVKGHPVNSTLEAVQAINKLSLLHEEKTFLELVDHREKFFRSLADFSLYGQGWLNRLIYGDKTRTSLKAFGLETIKKKGSSTAYLA